MRTSSQDLSPGTVNKYFHLPKQGEFIWLINWALCVWTCTFPTWNSNLIFTNWKITINKPFAVYSDIDIVIKPLLVVFTALRHRHLCSKTNILTSIVQPPIPAVTLSPTPHLPQVRRNYHVVVDVSKSTFPVQDSSVDWQIYDYTKKASANSFASDFWKITMLNWWLMNLLDNFQNVEVFHDIDQKFFRKIKNIELIVSLFCLDIAALPHWNFISKLSFKAEI